MGSLSTWMGYFSDTFGIVGGIVMIYQGFRFIELRKEYKRRMQELDQPANETDLVINFSGHPMQLSEGNWLAGKRIVDVHIGNLPDLGGLEKEADDLLNHLDESVLKDLCFGKPIVIALPGMSVLTQVLLPKLHALSGRFPMVSFAKHDVSGWIWNKPIDLHVIRTNSRVKRWELVGNSKSHE